MANIFDTINSPLGSTIGHGITYTPQQQSQMAVDQANALWQSPMGQSAQRAMDETTSFNKQQALNAAKNERDRIKIAKGQAAADKWYKEEQIRILQLDHDLKAREAEATATGYWNGSPTLAREQQAASMALQAGQLGASLRGPRNWATYLRTAYDTANSPVSSFVSTVPGGLGQGSTVPQRLTLRDVLGDFGVGGAGGAGAPTTVAAYSPNGVTAADLGLSNQDETTLRDYFNSPTHAPGGWWESKTEDQRQYLRGLAEEWGFSPDSIEARYRNSRPGQQSAFAA